MTQKALGIDLEQAGPPELWFAETDKTDGGYVTSLTLGGTPLTGLTLWREVLVRDNTPLLRSPAFEVTFDGERFVFTSYGAGHGCGMSQAGAAAMAKEGQNHAAILSRYFPGTSLITWR